MSAPRKPRIAELVAVRWELAERPWRGWRYRRAEVRGLHRFHDLMRDAEASGLVRVWDDGRDRWMWYEARRGKAERALRAKCVAAIGADPSEVRP